MSQTKNEGLFQQRKVDPLIKLINDDPKLSADERMLYRSLAELYIPKLRDNLLATSIDLSQAYDGTSITEWQEFLNHYSIKTYLDALKQEYIASSVTAGLLRGGTEASSAVRVQAQMEKNSTKSKFENYVIFRLPPKKDAVFDGYSTGEMEE